jgi:extracellular factor (EF) 3-hydroxypalmitic acid methyl ester biosynthesis protein
VLDPDFNTRSCTEALEMYNAITLNAALGALLDEAYAHLAAERGFDALTLIHTPLNNLFCAARSCGKERELLDTARRHPLYQIAQQDPFTNRCAKKPRGYAGDAVMLDYIYSRVAPIGTSIVGQRWFDFTTVGAMSLSVRYRKAFLQSVIDDTVSQRRDYQILSIASGHCREIEGSLVLNNRFSGRFVAFDQDPESCEFVERARSADTGGRVEVVNKSVRALLSERLALHSQKFHLIYSAGLYDYLNEPTAAALTDVLKAMLHPGGRLVIANFLPESSSRGYAEAFMDWRLIYRTPEELAAIFGVDMTTVKTQIDPHGNVVYAAFQSALPQ